MHFTEYQHDAMSYRLPSATPEYALLNLAGEVGELMSLEAKCIRDGAEWGPFLDNAKKELGDILWCLTAVATDYGFTLEEVAKANTAKLAQRKINKTIQGNGDDR